MTNYVFIDCETTGLKPEEGCRVIQFAGCRTDGVFYEQYFMVNDVPDVITQLTGISKDTLKQKKAKPFCKEDALNIQKFLNDFTVVGYNVNFDLNFLNSEFAKVGIGNIQNNNVDVLPIVRNLIPREKVVRYSLSNVCNYYGITFDAHNALNDTIATMKLAKQIKLF